MTHENHISEDDLILSIVDKNSLNEDASRHLDTCPECRSKTVEFESVLSNLGRFAKVHSPHPYRKITFDPAPRPVSRRLLPAFAVTFAILMGIAGTWWFASLDDTMNEQATAKVMLEMEQDSQLLDEIAELVTRAEENYSPPIFTEPNGSFSQEFMEFVIPFEDDQNEAGAIQISPGICA